MPTCPEARNLPTTLQPALSTADSCVLQVLSKFESSALDRVKLALSRKSKQTRGKLIHVDPDIVLGPDSEEEVSVTRGSYCPTQRQSLPLSCQ